MYDHAQLRVKRGNPETGFGYLADPVGHRYNLFHLHPAASLVSYPSQFSLLEHVPPRWDQDGTGSCTGHGFAGGITTTFSAKGKPLSSPACPRLLYTLGRAVDRSSASVPLTDVGAYPNSLVRAIGEWGVALEEDEDGGRTATSPDYSSYLASHVNDDPQLIELEDASFRVLRGFNSIGDGDSGKIDKFCQAISSGYAVMAAIEAGSSAFQSFTGNGVLDYTGSNPDHWIFFSAYRTNSQGKKEFLLINSWGFVWTPDGTAWVTERFITQGTFNVLIPNLGL